MLALPNQPATYKVYSRRYTTVDARGETGTAIHRWREGFVTGNGENGAIHAGAPYDDTLIYQNIHFLLPCETIRRTPDRSHLLDEVRQTIVRGQPYVTDDTVWHPAYCFHPGGQLRLTLPDRGCTDLLRWCDYETGEAVLQYTDADGLWERRTFTSRIDNVTITRLASCPAGQPVEVTLSFDDISRMYKNREAGAENRLRYKKLADADGETGCLAQIAHYPAFEGSELAETGYATLVYVFAPGGTVERVRLPDTHEPLRADRGENPALHITGAQAVYLIARSDRDLAMGSADAFAAAPSYPLLDRLRAACRTVIGRYGSYEDALAPSAAAHGALFRAVRLSLGDTPAHALSNEDLLARQTGSPVLEPAMLERAYHAGRYAMICCSGGNAIGRLCGLWTGEWAPRWNGGYTMDANVNLQCAGMNSAACLSYGESYIRFVLRQIDDWKTNALHNYGFRDAIQVPCNYDGDCALTVEYSTVYPFEYWNSGASWMLQPIFEFWQTWGDRVLSTDEGDKRLLADILHPLLRLHANFWAQMLTPAYYTDAAGGIHYAPGKTALADDEFYCILPGYSPENMPGNSVSARAANCTADISAARKGFDMLIAVETALDPQAFADDIAHWQRLSAKLPPYRFDETGAIKEWAAACFTERNEHRHISHLYPAWPSHETQSDPALAAACLQAMENRNRAGDESEETQTHGWLHKGLVAARLKNREQVFACLHRLLATRVYYESMLTDHNTHRGSDCYCIDTALGIIGLIDEMLLYSDTGVIELLPALPDALPEGQADGLLTCTRAAVSLSWTTDTVTAAVTSAVGQTIRISCAGQGETVLSFAPGETRTLTFSRHA